MRFETLQAWLAWQETLNPAGIDLGLERVQQVFQRMQLPALAATLITVAGTNGKGSTVAITASILTASGHSVGVYTSPHLLRYNERVLINGIEVSDEDFCAAFAAVDAARQDVSLTYFEFGTLAAFWLFAQQPLDVVILEVGLGGRLDAVNVVDADIAVITSISLDHQDWLGHDRETIGLEKAGIIKPGATVILAEANPPFSVVARAQAVGTKVLRRQVDFDGDKEESWAWTGYNRHGSGDLRLGPAVRQVRHLPSNALPRDSAITAMQMVHCLPFVISEAALVKGLAAVELAGRFQRLEYKGLEIIFDVAHNPAAAELLAHRLTLLPRPEKVVAIFAAMADKDIAGMIPALKPCFDAWFLADLPDNPRAKPAREVAELLFQGGVHMISVSKNLRQAMARVTSMLAPGDRVVVFGSFFTVAPLLERVLAGAVELPGDKPDIGKTEDV